ncbi:hypothetical protein BH11ARM2_BH11ARM2_04360 [soil metagenome]
MLRPSVWISIHMILLLVAVVAYQLSVGFNTTALGYLVPLLLCIGTQVWLWRLCRRIGDAETIQTTLSVDEGGFVLESRAVEGLLTRRRFSWNQVRTYDRGEVGFDLILDVGTNRSLPDQVVSEEACRFALDHATGKR